MRKYCVPCENPYLPRKSCVNTSKFWFFRRVPCLLARPSCTKAPWAAGSSQVLQSPSSSGDFVQSCAVYCCKEADNGLWQANIVVRPGPKRWMQQCSKKSAPGQWWLLFVQEQRVSNVSASEWASSNPSCLLVPVWKGMKMIVQTFTEEHASMYNTKHSYTYSQL